MAKKKSKSKDWLDQQVDELNDAFADELSKLTAEDIPRITGKKSKETWPKVTVGSHSVRTEYEDGRVELVTDWEALQRDVRAAIAKYEANIPAATIKQEKPKRARAGGKFVADDPTTPENEAWVGGKAPAKITATKKPARKKNEKKIK
jgi:hypothetical protein